MTAGPAPVSASPRLPRSALGLIVVVSTVAAVAVVDAAWWVAAEGWSAPLPLIVALVAGWAASVALPALAVPRASGYVVAQEELFVLPLLVVLGPRQLILCAAAALVTGRLVARVASPVERLRRTALQPPRVGFAVGKAVVEVVAAWWVVDALAPGPPGDARVLAAISGVALFYALSVLSVGTIRQLAGDASLREHVRTELDRDRLTVLLGSVTVGAVLAVASIHSELSWLWASLAGLLVLVHAAGMRRAREEREQLGALLRAVDALAPLDTLQEVERTLCEHARLLTDSDVAQIRELPPLGDEIGTPLTGWHDRWLVVRDRTTVAAPYAAEDVDTLRGLAAVASGALASARLVDELRRSDGMKSDLIAAVAHDVRAPVANAASLAHTLELRYEQLDAGTVRQLLRSCADATRRANAIIDDLLDLKRIEHGALADAASCDVGAVVREVAASLDLGDAVTLRLEGTATTAAIAPVKLNRVLDNLVRNGARYSPPGAPIVVRYGPSDGGAHITVTDHGPGVPPELRTAVFHPFAQGNQPSPGVGLGLYVVRRFVEFHGGRVWIEDAEEGGAAFHVWLPGPERAATADPAAIAPTRV